MIEIQPHPYHQLELTSGWTVLGETAEILIGKASYQYDLEGNVQPLAESEPLSQSDEYPEDDPENHAPVCFRETVPFKRGSEIVMFATAHCATPRSGFNVEATLSTEDGIQWRKMLSVMGPRTWKSSLLGAAYSDPEPITELPIRYEYAFGGRNKKKEHDVYPTNPVGRGYVGNGLKKTDLNMVSLPQIEAPGNLIKKTSDTPEPQGFGPIPPHWQPRQAAFASLDEDKAASREKYPYSGPLPETAYHSAPMDQWFDKPLHGPASLTLTGLTQGLPEHQTLTIDWTIPSLEVLWKTRSVEDHITLKADTLVVDTEKRQLHLLYRRAFTQLPKRLMAELHVVDHDLATDTEAAHG